MRNAPSLHAFLLLSLFSVLPTTGQSPPGPPAAEVVFSPRGGCTERIVNQLQEAKSEVLMQAYDFTSQPIATALIAASRRGVAVRVIIDEKAAKQKPDVAKLLQASAIDVKVDGAHRIAHNKVIIIDHQLVLTGSFNFTSAAEYDNAENSLLIRDPQLADTYRTSWTSHMLHSSRFSPPSIPSKPDVLPSSNVR